MRAHPALLLSLALCAAAGCTSSTPAVASAPPAAMTRAPAGFWDHWGDGRAELSGYTLTQPRYGELRQGEAVLVVVTEELTAAQRVKSDGGHGDEYPVLKLNEMRDFQTGLYDYNVMTSSWLRLDGVVPLGLPDKVSFSMQEWCGHVYEELQVQPASLDRLLHSYFDGESSGRHGGPLPERGVISDAMPLLVRGLGGELVAPGSAIEVPWLASAQDRRFAHAPLAWTSASLSRSSGTRTMEVPAGSFEAFTVTAKPASGATTSWFVEAAPPHRLLGWERDDGERAALTGVSRRAYWREHDNGHEALRAELGLPAHAWPGQEAPTSGAARRPPGPRRVQQKDLDESSGLVASRAFPGVFWSHNDSGGKPELFGFDVDGVSRARFHVSGVPNEDWEDIAADAAGGLWIHDGGNNKNKRRDLTVYRVSEPSSLSDTAVAADRAVRFVFPEQTAFPDKARMNYDSEALFWDGDRLLLLTKHRSDTSTMLYRFPADITTAAQWALPRPSGGEVAPARLEALGSFDVGGNPDLYGGQVTAADLSTDGRRLAVLTYHALLVFERPEGNPNWLAGPVHRISLNQAVAKQCEAVAWDGNRLVFTNEDGEIFVVGRPLDPGCTRFPDAACDP